MIPTRNLEHILSRAEQHCIAQGSRLTRKRKQVLSGLIKTNRALSAYELADIYASEFGETLPAMSVYRILDFLIDENLVHKLDLANKYIACGHISCDHSHGVSQFLICHKCNKVKEITINSSTFNDLETSVKNAGFHLNNPRLELSCICEDCSDKDTNIN